MDARDAVLMQATPLVPVPRFGALDTLAVGRKRFLGASEGLLVEARSSAMHVATTIAATTLPFGALKPFIRLTAGPIPLDLLRQFIRAATRTPNREIAAAIVLDDAHSGYELVELPIESSSGGHVRYLDVVDDDRLVMDLHSHATHGSFFSGTDDQSDLSRQGPYLACVLGHCDREQQQIAVRLVLPPYLVDMHPADLRTLGVIQ